MVGMAVHRPCSPGTCTPLMQLPSNGYPQAQFVSVSLILVPDGIMPHVHAGQTGEVVTETPQPMHTTVLLTQACPGNQDNIKHAMAAAYAV